MSGRKLSYRPRFANKKVINPHPVRRVVAVQKVGATISKWQRPKTHEALAIVRPDTVVRWHRAGFRCYWRWRSRSRPGRPAVGALPGSMANCSSSASILGRPASPSICRAGEDRRPKAGRRSCAIRWGCGDGFVRSADRLVSAALWAADHEPRPATNPVARRHRAAHGGMDCQPTDGGLWLGANPSR